MIMRGSRDSEASECAEVFNLYVRESLSAKVEGQSQWKGKSRMGKENNRIDGEL